MLRCNRIGCPSETTFLSRPLSIAPAFVPSSPKRHFILSRFSLKANRFYTPPLLGTNASEKEPQVDFFRAEAETITNSRKFHTDMIPQRSGSSKGDATPCVAAMQPHRLPVGDYISIISQCLKFVSCASIRPPFPQKALHTFKIFH